MNKFERGTNRELLWFGYFKEWFKIDDPKWYGIWIQQKQEENKEDQEKGRSKEVQKQLSRYH